MPHFYERNIVEIREELTQSLINILTPFLYEDIKSFYNYALNSHKQLVEKRKFNPNIECPDILKLFQLVLREVQTLNNHAIEKETRRIKEKSKCSEWFDDLIKAVIKSNIILLTFSPKNKSSIVDSKYHESIDTNNFIHKCLIESALAIYNCPELFWHDYPPLEIKRNQREVCKIIEKAIKEAIRKVLPTGPILKEFLKNDYIPFDDYKMTESQYISTKNLVDGHLNNRPYKYDQNVSLVESSSSSNNHDNNFEEYSSVTKEDEQLNEGDIQSIKESINSIKNKMGLPNPNNSINGPSNIDGNINMSSNINENIPKEHNNENVPKENSNNENMPKYDISKIANSLNRSKYSKQDIKFLHETAQNAHKIVEAKNNEKNDKASFFAQYKK